MSSSEFLGTPREELVPTRETIGKVMAQATIGLKNTTPAARNEARYDDVKTFLISDTVIELTNREISLLLEDLPSYEQWEKEGG